MNISASFEKLLLDLPRDKKGLHTLTFVEQKKEPDDRALLSHLKRFCLERSLPVNIQSVVIETVEELHPSWCCTYVPKQVWKVNLIVKMS